jgi:hypothetical protein
MAIIDLVPGQPATISEHPVHGKPRKHESRLHSQTA